MAKGALNGKGEGKPQKNDRDLIASVSLPTIFLKRLVSFHHGTRRCDHLQVLWSSLILLGRMEGSRTGGMSRSWHFPPPRSLLEDIFGFSCMKRNLLVSQLSYCLCFISFVLSLFFGGDLRHGSRFLLWLDFFKSLGQFL